MIQKIFLKSLVIYLIILQNAFSQNIQNIQDDIIQRQRQWQKQEQLKFNKKWQKEKNIEITKPIKKNIDNKCITIKQIKLNGITLFKKDRLDKITNKWIDKCLSLNELNEIANEITLLYLNAGYSTSRAYFTKQDLQDGILILQIFEGKINQIIINNDKSKFTNAFGNINNNILNIYDLEQGLDQINRLRSHNATLQIVPSKEMGASDILIKDEVSKKWLLDLVFDNYGANNTGRNSITETATINDVFGMHEMFSFTIKTDTTNNKSKNFKNFSSNFSIPYGKWSFNLANSFFEYETNIFSQNQNNKAGGTEKSTRAQIDRVIKYNNSGKVTLGTYLQYRNNKNTVNGITTNVNSNKSSNAGISLTHLGAILGGVSTSSLTYERGLKILGAIDDDDVNILGKYQYNLFKADLSYFKNFAFDNFNLILENRTQIQLSPDILLSAQQMNLANSYSVRGFKDQSLNVTNGLTTTNNLIFDTNLQNGSYTKYIGKIQPLIGLDFATGFKSKNPEQINANLASATLGVRTSGDNFSGEVTFEKPIFTPKELQNEGTIIRFKLNLKI